MQNCVSLRSPILDFGSKGPSKIEKHPIFDVLAHKNTESSLFLNRFSSNRATNACIAKPRVATEPDVLFWVRGAVKKRKTNSRRKVAGSNPVRGDCFCMLINGNNPKVLLISLLGVVQKNNT